jgi:putative serine protease PepD
VRRGYPITAKAEFCSLLPCHAGSVTGDRNHARPLATGESPWWSDALSDPWRDPTTPTQIVLPAAPQPASPPLEPVPHPGSASPPGRWVGVILVTALLTGLLAGVLGGALGYTYANRDAGGTILGADPANAPAAAEHPPDSVAAVVDRMLPSVVTIRSESRQGNILGSGVVASSDGYLITNDHVVGPDEETVTVTFHDGTVQTAALVGRDPESDVAVLKVDRDDLTPAVFGDSDRVAVGDPVLAFGSPLALANTVTAGIVSAVDRTIRSDEPGGPVRYYAAIQTDAAVNQGNSGGPLVDLAGRVIGINSVIRTVAPQASEAGSIGLAFAIPIRQAQRVATEIIETGQANRTVIGAELNRNQSGSDGARLEAVVEGGPADLAGLRAGDVVVRMDDKAIESPTDLIALVRKHDPGAVVRVEYLRGSAPATASVTLVADRG